MNEEDLKTRKQWIVLWMISTISSVLSLLFQPEEPLLAVFSPAIAKGIVYSSVVCGLLYQYAFYHFSYKNKGTKWLTVMIALTPMSLLGTLAIFLLDEATRPQGWRLFFTLLQSVLATLWFFANLKMRALNVRLKRERIA